MSVRLLSETLMSLPDACLAFPGRKVSLPTLHRWRNSGARGICLETVLVGGRRMTSMEAIQRFLAAQNGQSGSGDNATS